MKMLICLVMLVVGSLNAQTYIERMGGSITPPPRQKSTGEIASEKMRAQNAAAKDRLNALNNANNYRVVDGKLYNSALATNWVNLPGDYERGKCVEKTTNGVVFTLERKQTQRWGTGITQATVWYEYDRDVVVKNFSAPIAVGDAMPSMRALPVGTTSKGLALFDLGTPPKASSTNTLAAAKP